MNSWQEWFNKYQLHPQYGVAFNSEDVRLSGFESLEEFCHSLPEYNSQKIVRQKLLDLVIGPIENLNCQ